MPRFQSASARRSWLAKMAKKGLKWLGKEAKKGVKWLGKEAKKGVEWLGSEAKKGVNWVGKEIKKDVVKVEKWLASGSGSGSGSGGSSGSGGKKKKVWSSGSGSGGSSGSGSGGYSKPKPERCPRGYRRSKKTGECKKRRARVPGEKRKRMPEDVEDCVACRYVWLQVEMDVGNSQIEENIYDSFYQNSLEAQKAPIFYPGCQTMFDSIDDMIGDYMDGYTVNQLCENSLLCR